MRHQGAVVEIDLPDTGELDEAKEKRRLLLAYCAGGAVALTYQIVWFHAFVERFGATGTTFLTVLCAFIGGLGAGSFASRTFYRKLDSVAGGLGLKNYGRTELAVAVTAILTLSIYRLPVSVLLGEFPYQLQMLEGLNFYVPTAGYQFLKIAAAVVGIGIPCFLMGLTFPYLCSLYPDDPRFPSRLYAANTLGACLAVISVEFFGLIALGYLGCLSIAALVNLGIGLIFLRASRRELPDFPVQILDEGRSASAYPGILSGFLCGGLQALAFVLLKFTLGPSKAAYALLTFFAILGIWLAATIVHRWKPSRGLLVIFCWIAIAWCAGIWIFEAKISEAIVVFGVQRFTSMSPYAAGFLATAMVVGIQVFVPYFFWSMLLPDLCDRLQAEGRGVSRIYGWNTMSFLAGICMFGWALQYVHFFFAARVFAVCAVLGITLLTLRHTPRWREYALVAVALAIIVPLLPRNLELRLAGGLSTNRRVVSDFRSTPQHLFWVTRPGSRESGALMFDRHSMSATSPYAQVYMRSMAHFPLLLQKSPQKALLICFGVGTTADAIRNHDSIRQLDIVDLNRSVFELNHNFRKENHDVLKDPRIRIIIDDGRQFLSFPGDRYDLITMEPPPPLQLGISRLYSMEFYDAVRARLTPGGIVSQWLPEGQLDNHAVDLIARTFVQSFPHVFLFTGCNRELILVGSNQPFDFDRVLLPASPAVQRDFITFQAGPEQFLRSILKTEEGMRAIWGEGEVISDGFASLEAIHVGPVQQLHPQAEFLLFKTSLRYDLGGVQAHMKRTAPKAARLIADFYANPFVDPAVLDIVPPMYFPNSELLINKKKK